MANVTVISDKLQDLRDTLSNYGVYLPRDVYKYDASVFAMILSTNLKHKGEFLYMKSKKYLLFEGDSFNTMRKTFLSWGQKMPLSI